MEFRIILKKYINDFLMIQAGITLAIGVISCIRPPQMGINRLMFLCPFYMLFSVSCRRQLCIQKRN